MPYAQQENVKVFVALQQYERSSSAIAEKAGIIYWLSASLAYREAAEKCANTLYMP